MDYNLNTHAGHINNLAWSVYGDSLFKECPAGLVTPQGAFTKKYVSMHLITIDL